MKKLSYLLPFLLAACHIAVVRGRDLVTFHSSEKPAVYVYAILGAFCILLVLFYGLLLSALRKLLARDKAFLSYFRFFLEYFLFMGVF